MTTTHTPGPWATYINGGKDGWIANAEGDLIACAVRGDNMAANARLIAATPDLLAALEALADCAGITALPGFRAELDAAMKDARAAIANAKGE